MSLLINFKTIKPPIPGPIGNFEADSSSSNILLIVLITAVVLIAAYFIYNHHVNKDVEDVSRED